HSRAEHADDRAARRHSPTAAGDRGRDAPRAAARVGARSGDVPEAARPLPDLPVSIVLGGLFAVTTALALGLRSPSPEGRGGQGVRTESRGGQGVRVDTLWLQNARLRLGFDPSNGSLLNLTDRSSGQSFVDPQRAVAIWRLDRLGPGDSSVIPGAARSFSWHALAGGGPGLALVWSDFGL